MDRHVIKGRGKNRKKYLCYARMAGLTPESGYVWLPEQSKAVRWENPSYSRDAHRDRIAAEHDGYFVNLVAPKSVIERVDELKTFIAKHARGTDVRPDCYWLDGDWSGDEGEDFCWECACKEVDKEYATDPLQFAKLYGYADDDDIKPKDAEDYYDDAIRGGYSMDHDLLPYCMNDDCGVALDGTLTEDGADKEISVLTTDYAPSFDDAEGWYALNMAVMNIYNDDPRWKKIARVVDAAIEAERQYVANQDVLTASEGMTEVRGVLLDLLAVRKEQKAPEPSYPMWNELLEWRKRRFEEMYLVGTKELRRAMFKAAKRFAATLGYAMSGDCIEAPYGGYIWHFIIVIEQYRLWKPNAFMEGRAYMLQPCPSGDPSWPHNRDDNPYQNGTEECCQWDSGYISAKLPLP